MLKMISWNVNGLRACVTKGFLEYVKDGMTITIKEDGVVEVE